MSARRWTSLGLATALLACGVDTESVATLTGAAGTAGNAQLGGAAGSLPVEDPGSGGSTGGTSAKGGGAGTIGAGAGGSSGKGNAAAMGGAGGAEIAGAGGAGGEAGTSEGGAGQGGEAGTGSGGKGGAGPGGGGPGGAGPGGADAGGSGGEGPGGAAMGGSGGSGPGGGGQGGMTGAPRCGDGLVNQPDEECDDANQVEADACTNVCKVPCPPGGKFVAETRRCYFLSANQGAAYSADGGPVPDPCAGPGTHIAMLTHPDDAYQVRQGTAFEDAWLGARTFDDDGSDDPSRYRWFEGPSLHDGVWAPSEPSDFDSRRCVAFTKDGGDVSYENRTCSESKRSLCVREPVCFVSGRLGFVGPSGHCFVTHPAPLDRAGAAAICSATYGGYLASFPAPEELALLGGLGIREHWVGALQLANGAEPGEGWTWPAEGDAALASDADQWAGDRPDDGALLETPAEEDCAVLTRGRRLDDRACTGVRPALCEVP